MTVSVDAEQLVLNLNLPECKCLTFRDYHTGQRSIEFKQGCAMHQVYLDNFWFRMNMFYLYTNSLLSVRGKEVEESPMDDPEDY